LKQDLIEANSSVLERFARSSALERYCGALRPSLSLPYSGGQIRCGFAPHELRPQDSALGSLSRSLDAALAVGPNPAEFYAAIDRWGFRKESDE
jgi:hypothetical protein